MTTAAGQGKASRTDLAYLTDRVLLAEGEPQEYGTQAMVRDGRYAPRNLRDPGGVDERRASAGLPPLAEYLEHMTQVSGPPGPRLSARFCHSRDGATDSADHGDLGCTELATGPPTPIQASACVSCGHRLDRRWPGASECCQARP
jgi:hypothetical protein